MMATFRADDVREGVLAALQENFQEKQLKECLDRRDEGEDETSYCKMIISKRESAERWTPILAGALVGSAISFVLAYVFIYKKISRGLR